jgi:hypothetical protein
MARNKSGSAEDRITELFPHAYSNTVIGQRTRDKSRSGVHYGTINATPTDKRVESCTANWLHK